MLNERQPRNKGSHQKNVGTLAGGATEFGTMSQLWDTFFERLPKARSCKDSCFKGKLDGKS